MALFDDYYPPASHWADRLVMVLEQMYQRWRDEGGMQPQSEWEQGYRQAKDQDALELQRTLEELVPGWYRR